jgi:hypothetical protein
MLYRTPRFSLLKLLGNAATRIAGAIAAGNRTAAETSLLDGLSEHQLRDLGVRRYVDTHFQETFYG